MRTEPLDSQPLDTEQRDTEAQLAVIGMAVRLPGARTLAEYWRNLAGGIESIVELPAPEGARHRPACGVLEDPDCFDAEFFGYAPREALIIDPQHRLFLECAWEALEHAGYDPARYPGPIGVYAGSSQTGYSGLLHARRDSQLLADVAEFELRLGCGLDFLTTRASYKLGLRGPAVTVQTACSTSLVAIHLAGQALLAGECDMALAGGATVHVPTYPGEYSETGILSADGHCRAFDAAAGGTVGGDGAGIVVLKRLADALEDGDTVHAVVLGSAINNDGADKIGYTAPSVSGQAEAVHAALRLAGITSDSVSYIETHGTGTPLGDPIEIAALASAFRAVPGSSAPRHGACWIGSVKTNIGHTDAAAGVAGFIKTVLALRHRQIPPSLHFQTPNPAIDFAATPFEVNTRLRDWTAPGPLRAGVNSLGIGGTNAHVVLEEAPGGGRPTQLSRSWRVAPFSGRTRQALATVAAALTSELTTEPAPELADLAWTLQTGRRPLAYRGFAVAQDIPGLAAALASADLGAGPASTGRQPLAFLFPGQGGQYVGMTAQLAAAEPALRQAVADCARLFQPALGRDLREVLYASSGDPVATGQLQAMPMAQACVFTAEYALATLWQRWGVAPDAVAGHSLGAYAAGCIAGVFELPDAVALVADRARLLDALPPGAMIAVSLPEAELRTLLEPGLSIAAVNGPDQCVVSGPRDDVTRFAADLAGRGLEVRLLHITAAAHSSLVEPVVRNFHDTVATLRLNPPSLPMLSDHTGRWLTAEQACDPAYWAAHLRATVRFGDVLAELVGDADRHALIEVGPGRTLTSLARRHPAHRAGDLLLTSLPHAVEDEPEAAHLLRAAGQLWQAGRELDWAGLNEGERHRRVPLPTAAFQRLRFRIDPDPAVPVTIEPAVRPDTDVEADADGYVEPRGAVQQAVAAAFERVLGTARVGAQDSFLDLGGDSLIAARLTAWIRHEYGMPVTVREIFTTHTVETLASRIEAFEPAETPDRPQEVEHVR
ncbi:MAG TPA: beta-ketoacyl synthase N-terminal-like domain-containing protein [Jatrophihabitans sp.]|jgi:acyl transferase domain-containing protein|uniref:type I polyketide synthase n=1 Tax=Jatrophihabitans sp. TaxID=1932789 RepID=UPI002F150971